MLRQTGRAGIFGKPCNQPVDVGSRSDRGRAERRFQLGQSARPQIGVGDAGIDRVGRLEPRAGKAEKHADPARTPGQEIRSADVGKQADASFRHGEGGALGDDPVRTVHRNADAAAHHDAVDQGDVGLREMVDRRIQAVFIPVE